MKDARVKVVAALLLGAVAGGLGTYLVVAPRFNAWPYTADRGLPASQRPLQWGSPISLPGLPNLHKVSDDLYRGAQPTAEGIAELKKLGVKRIVNLRELGSDRDELGSTGLGYVHIPMNPGHPEDEDVVAFLKVMADPSRRPVFVHCHAGADRTGMMVAAYRVVVQGWSKDEAVDEMTRGGYGYHKVYGDLVEHIRKLDAEKTRGLAGLAQPATR